MSRRTGILCTVFFALWSGIGLAEEKATETLNSIESLNEAIQSLMTEHHTPSVSYVIFNKDGLLTQHAVGYRDVAQQLNASPNTLYRVGSITKTLTAIAIMQMIEQGKFTLDTPVRSLIPEVPIVNSYEDTHPVRLVHLLEHTAGFDDMHFKGMYREKEILNAHSTAFNVDPEPLKVRWLPGTMHSYSNPGYGVLGAIIERHSGQSWEDYIRSHVLNPLAMNHSVLTIAEAKSLEHAIPYTDDNVPTDYSALYLRAAGVLWSTPEDLSKLARFFMTQGRTAPQVLRAESIQQMLTVHSTLAANAGLPFGYSLGLYQSIRSQRVYIGHNGGITGFSATMGYDPVSGIGYAEIHNSDMVGSAFSRKITDYIANTYTTEKTQLAVVAPPQELVGWYRLKNSRNELMRLPEWLFGVASFSLGDDNQLVFSPVLNASETFVIHASGLLADVKDQQWTGAILRKDGEIIGVEIGGQYFERISVLSALLPPIAFLFAILALLSAPFGRRRALRHAWSRRLPTLSLVSLIGLISLLFNLSLTTVAQINLTTAGIFVLSLAFPLLALAGVYQSIRHWQDGSPVIAKWRCLLGSMGALYLAVLFTLFHITGLALWAW